MIDEKLLRQKLNQLFHFRWGKTFETYPNHKEQVAALIEEVIAAATIEEEATEEETIMEETEME